MKRSYLLVLFLCCLFMAGAAEAKSKTKVIAHRGYWRCEGSAQNSLHSLEQAAAVKVYGSEFDVHLTSDNVIVVNHDNTIDGIDIQTTPYSKLKDQKLSNGETLPTLRQYLETAKGLKHIQLILEIKSHATPERNREAARLTLAMVREMNLAKRTEFISFDLDACKELIKEAPKAKVFYLNGELTPAELQQMGFAGLDYQDKVIDQHPEWIREAKQLGMKTNVWTVNEDAKMKEYAGMGVDFITTNEPVKAQQIIRSL